MNPYAVRSAFKDPDMFFGRNQELKTLGSRLNSMQSCAIVGPRRMGKSSLLTYLCREDTQQKILQNAAGYIFVYIDLQELAGCAPDDFFQMAIDRIGRSGKLPFPVTDADATRRGFSRFLEKVCDNGFHIVICCDEFEEWSSNQAFDVSFFSFLRALASRYIAFVTASRSSLFTLCHQGNVQTSQFWNVFSETALGPLSPEAATSLIQEPFLRAGRSIKPDQVNWLLNLAGEHPFFLQIACFHQYEMSDDIAPDQLGHIEKTFLEEAAPHYQYTWEHLEDACQQCALDFLAHKTLPPADKLKVLQQQGIFCIASSSDTKISRGWISFLRGLNKQSQPVIEDSAPLPQSPEDEADTPREIHQYLDFDLLIEPVGKRYRARVVSAPGGHGTYEFDAPFSDVELENLMLKMGNTRKGTRRHDSPEIEAIKTFGGRLFESVFSGAVQTSFQNSLTAALQQGRGLRLKLRLGDAPYFLNLPWEYLYTAASNRFFALSLDSPVIRFLETPEQVTPLPIQPPLRILVMISSPSDYAHLDSKQEWEKILKGLSPLIKKGRVKVDLLEQSTLQKLHQATRREKYHILHFIGHSGFDRNTQDGILILENADGRGHAVSGQDLGMILHDEKTLYLVVLNSCEGGRAASDDSFAGVAQAIIQQGIPAVVAMQFEITDDAAILFSHEFYDCIASGLPVDIALTEARKSIFSSGSIEWGKPVLYLSSPDGRIFDIMSQK